MKSHRPVWRAVGTRKRGLETIHYPDDLEIGVATVERDTNGERIRGDNNADFQTLPMPARARDDAVIACVALRGRRLRANPWPRTWQRDGSGRKR
jgi:hypothetical protein